MTNVSKLAVCSYTYIVKVLVVFNNIGILLFMYTSVWIPLNENEDL